MKAINIKWDTDGNKRILQDLPTEIIIPDYLEKLYESDRENALEEISDWLSEETGFCHDGFEIVDGIKEIITEYITDTITKVKSNIDCYNYEMLIEFDGNDDYKFYYLNGSKPCDPDFEYWVLCNM